MSDLMRPWVALFVVGLAFLMASIATFDERDGPTRANVPSVLGYVIGLVCFLASAALIAVQP